MPTPASGPGGRTLVLFAVAVVLGGSNFLAVRLSNLDLPPFWGAGLRFSLAAGGFYVLVLALRLTLPRGRSLWHMAGYGVLSIAAFYALMYWALLTVTAGVASVVLALVPLVTVLLAAAQRLERLRPRSVIGGLVAVAGIAWLTLEPGHGSLPLGALLALLVAVACVSESVIVAKRLQRHHPATINAVALTVGAVVLLALSAAVGERWSLPQRPEAAWALAYLVTLGSIGLFLVVLTVVRRWTASATSYLFVLFPVATMALEALLLGEPITLAMAGGAVVVMTGVWLGAFAPARPAATGDAVASTTD
jgi:drug/metabolite transporter (DMT)-like permease